MLNSYLDINFEVIIKTDKSRYANGDDKKLVNLETIALLSNFKLTTSPGKHLEDNRYAHIIFLMYKSITSAKNTDDLSKGFDRSRDSRNEELTEEKNVKGKYQLTIMLKDVFGFAEHQEKATHGLGYKLT